MADAMSSPSITMDELYIRDTIDLLIVRKDEISIRFTVEIKIEKPTTACMDDGCWVSIVGSEEKVKTAKDYIRNLCTPEDIGTTEYPGEFHSRLSDKEVVFDLEKKYKSVVEFNDGENPEDPGEAIVKGDSLAVALTLSAIEDMIATYQEQSRMSLGDITDTTVTPSVLEGYSQQTSHRLDDTVRGMSDQLSLEQENLDNYNDVMKKLILGWANEDSTNERETITLDSDEDNTTVADSTTQRRDQNTESDESDDSDIEEEGVIDYTRGQRSLGPQTSTPLVTSSQTRTGVGGIKIEKIPAPSPLATSSRTPARPVPAPRSGQMYVDLTDSTSSSGVSTPAGGGGGVRRYTLDSETSDDEPTTVSTRPKEKSARPGNISPTTQTQKHISTITISDDTTITDDITDQLDSPPSLTCTTTTTTTASTTDTQQKDEDEVDSVLQARLVNSATGRGYNEMEIAQALSLCVKKGLNEQRFFSQLNNVRQANKPSTQQQQQPAAPKRKNKKKRNRNVALEGLQNKQHEMETSPRSVASSPYEKRVRTQPQSQQQERPGGAYQHSGNVPQNSLAGQPSSVPHLSYNPDLYNQPSTSQAPPSTSQAPPPPIQQQLHQIRAQHSQQYQQRPPQLLTVTPLAPPPIPGVQLIQQPPPPPVANPPLPTDLPELPPMPARPELPNTAKNKCRMVVLDGSNIAYHHGNQLYPGKDKIFSCKGILIAIDYLRKTYGATHETLKAIVPRYRASDRYAKDVHLLNKMEESGFLSFSPCKNLGGRKIVPYDDRFILDLAVATDGVVISNDKYEDLLYEQRNKYTNMIRTKVIMYMFVGDTFMISHDPNGKTGPTLDQLLNPNTNRGAVAPRVQQQTPIYRQPAPQNYQQHQAAAQYGRQPQSTYGAAGGGMQPPALRHNQFYNGPNRFQTLGVLPQHITDEVNPNNHQQQGAGGHTGGPSKQRTAAESRLMAEQLLDMFPDKKGRINAILSRHPFEHNINMFIEGLLD